MASPALPEQVLNHLQQQHPDPDRFNQFVSTCSLPSRQAVRINTHKIAVSDFVAYSESRQWRLQPIPWCDDGFWITTEDPKALGNHIYHLAGLFYLQEATSMLPVRALFHNYSPELILDMAAAPGSKTSQLQNYLRQGYIVANDMSSSRLKMLNANLIRCGLADFALLHRDGRRLSETLPALFDGILLDAPCGGEGTIRKDPKAWSNWSIESLDELSSLQKELILSAWQLLRPGGRLIYSTCSLSREENQVVVQHLLSTVGDSAQLMDLSDLFSEARQVSTDKMLHIWPEVFDSEGFFVAAIQKAPSSDSSVCDSSGDEIPLPTKKQFEQVYSYLRQRFDFELPPQQISIRQSDNKFTLWISGNLPKQLETVKSQRCGVKICQLYESRKGTGITMDHEFVRTYGQQFNKSTIDISEQQATEYFQGKNIQTQHAVTEGEVVLRITGQPIGLGKVLKDGSIKNQLPRNLVHDNAWS